MILKNDYIFKCLEKTEAMQERDNTKRRRDLALGIQATDIYTCM